MVSDAVSSGRRLLKDKKYRRAINKLKKASVNSPGDPRVYYLMALSYILLGKEEGSHPFFLLAEEPARRAIKLSPEREEYHDLLVEIKSRTGKLGELSSEYRRKAEENPMDIYEKVLKKISAVGIMSIPDPDKKGRKRKHKGYFFIHYVIVPAVAAFTMALLMTGAASSLRNFTSSLLLIYIIVRIVFGRRADRNDKW